MGAGAWFGFGAEVSGVPLLHEKFIFPEPSLVSIAGDVSPVVSSDSFAEWSSEGELSPSDWVPLYVVGDRSRRGTRS